MSNPSAALLDIKQFLETLKLPIGDADFSSNKARQQYRRFHALLLWELAADPKYGSEFDVVYLKECLADIATAYFLNYSGAYKASRLCMRGAIENAVRVSVADCGVDILKITTVHDLFDSCRKNWCTNEIRLEILNNLYSFYRELCNTVHSTSVSYMALRIPFEKILEFNEPEFLKNSSLLDSIMKSLGECFYFTFHQNLKFLDYKNSDYIKDSVRKTVKKMALNEIQ